MQVAVGRASGERGGARPVWDAVDHRLNLVTARAAPRTRHQHRREHQRLDQHPE